MTGRQRIETSAGDDQEKALVERAVAGDREAFGQLVRRHGSWVFNLTRALTGDTSDAEDLAQEAFVRAYRSIGRFRMDSSFRTWLYRVTLNLVRSHLRRRALLRPIWGRSVEAGEAGGSDGTRHTPIEPARAETELMRRQAIDRALATLPPQLRVAVVLRDMEGMEYREIAETLGVPIGTVESRIFRARRRLRPLLASLVTPTETAGGLSVFSRTGS